MPDTDPLFNSIIPELSRIGRGKVRDIYAVDQHHLVIVTTDRLSAYDVVLPNPIEGKGEVLNKLSNFWFEMMEDLIPNHLTGISLGSVISDQELANTLELRSTVVRRLKPLPVEAVVRGYLIGSGWRDYQSTGEICGISLPKGLKQASQLPTPIFTPATKAEAGDHDENISYSELQFIIGEKLASLIRDHSIQIYERAAAHALDRNIIIADTKFEFGQDTEGRLYIIDEILTPDSSRFWPLSDYKAGISPPSYDKQFVRDHLDTLDWDKTAPGPKLPNEVLELTSKKYREALDILTT
ncbi:MAG: phosphoribosylaminoimidazolesuccinocarboxamide synthase [Woeseia sp.]|nr:phosphoribosylaminoimidazolesuccinocarboxamide synthase [Woeseia sp.]|tara:strand:+ start:2701 stop:3591 length:891 start_codon:yes stop_codon:yes gene_type:complete